MPSGASGDRQLGGAGISMTYPEQYRTELLAAIQSVDLAGVRAAVTMFREARAQGHRIFACGSGRSAMASSQLCGLVREASLTRSNGFRIFALTNELTEAGERLHDRIFVDQLKNIAEHGDVVVGVSSSGNSADLLRAFEYSCRIGCQNISITGWDGDKLASMANVAIVVRASHVGSVEDALMIVCHMIGYYFANYDRA